MRKNYNKITTKLSLLLLIVAICIGTNAFATTYGSSTVTQVATTTSAGATNAQILRVAVTGSGGGGGLKICQLQFVMQNTNNADVTAARVYYTGTSSTFATTTQYGATVNNPTGTISFSGTSADMTNLTYYFWLVFDISSSAGACANVVDAYVPTGGLFHSVNNCAATTAATPTSNNPAGSCAIQGPGCWTYCTSAASSTTYSDITNVTFNTINNTSAGSDCKNYTDFTAITTTVSPSASYNLTITKNNACTGTTQYTGRFGAWIDWNNDGDFADAGEQVLTDASASNGPVSATVTVPGTVVVGTTTRMRCVFVEGTTAATYCGTYSTWGETEDYSIYFCAQTTVVSSSASVVCSGSTVNLSATAGYTTIQWQSSTDNSTFTNISGATSATYTTPALTTTTYYRATTTPVCMGTSNTLTVTVNSTPSFSLQPTSTAQCRGTSTILSAGATPSSSTYQWQYWNGASWANVVNGTPANFTYTNATTADLTITTTTSATAGTYQYRCNATACSATASSSTATLTVNAAPTAGSITPLSTSGACGSIPAFSLTLTGGTGTIQWQYSGNGTTWTDVLNETSSTYAATASSTTYYRAVRTLNGCTSVQASTATVTVTGATAATYTGANGGAWTTAGNWSTGSVPTACTDVTIPAGKSVAVAAGTISTTVCHNLTVAATGTVTVNFPASSDGNYLFITGNLDNDGVITQSQQSTALSSGAAAGKCDKCGGISLTGQNVVWDGDGTYPILTVTIEDNSNITMVHDASIDFLNCTKTTVVGTLNLGAKTLQITNVFAQAGSAVKVNTGMLWLQIQQSMLVDQVTLYPEYGTVWFDLPGNAWGFGGDWTVMGGTGFYNLWERVGAAGSFGNGHHLCRKDFKIFSGGPVYQTAASSYTLTVKGDFINEGTFDHRSTNMVSMTGPGLVYDSQTNTFITSTARQNITGPSTTQFTNLTINHTGTQGVQLNGVNASVGNSTTAGVLACTDGPFYLNSQTLTINNGNTTAITRAAGCVVSETNSAVNPSVLTWNMGTTTGAHVVPFGTGDGAANYIPFTFNKTTAGSANISFSTRATSASDNLPWAGVSSVAAVNSMSAYDATNTTFYADGSLPSVIDRWWDITTSAAVTANLTFSFKGSENTTTSNPTGEFKAQHWNGSSWDAPVGTGTGVTSGVGTVTATGQSTFSPWVLSSLLIPLPVELEKFKVDCEGTEAVFNWSTVREQNNNYFTIEKSLDGINFYEVGRTYSTAKGLSSSNIEYSFKDANPSNAYYRLSQTDFNNVQKVLKMIHLNKCTTRKQYMNAYSVNDAIVIQADFDMQDEVEATVMNALGQIVGKRTLNLTEGFNEFKMENLGVNTGIYYLTISGKSIDTFSKKLLLAK